MRLAWYDEDGCLRLCARKCVRGRGREQVSVAILSLSVHFLGQKGTGRARTGKKRAERGRKGAEKGQKGTDRGGLQRIAKDCKGLQRIANLAGGLQRIAKDCKGLQTWGGRIAKDCQGLQRISKDFKVGAGGNGHISRDCKGFQSAVGRISKQCSKMRAPRVHRGRNRAEVCLPTISAEAA